MTKLLRNTTKFNEIGKILFSLRCGGPASMQLTGNMFPARKNPLADCSLPWYSNRSQLYDLHVTAGMTLLNSHTGLSLATHL